MRFAILVGEGPLLAALRGELEAWLGPVEAEPLSALQAGLASTTPLPGVGAVFFLALDGLTLQASSLLARLRRERPEVLQVALVPAAQQARPVAEGWGIDEVLPVPLGEQGFRVELLRQRALRAAVLEPLPAGDAANDPPSSVAARRRAAPLLRPRLMVIDDEPLATRAMERLLRHRYEVFCRNDAEAALSELLSGAAMDAVLCDVTMPSLSGVELHRRVEAQRPSLARRFLFITGGTLGLQASDLDRLRDRRIDKPAHLHQLDRALQAVIRGA